MCSWRPLAPVLIALAAVLAMTSTASAWTRAVVRGADAVVEVQPDASLDVLLELRVEVHAGWLHELELAGLGDGVELDRRRPPYLRSEEGVTFRPAAELTEDQRIRLSFERRGAPRKGEYRVFVRYRTRAEVEAFDETDVVRLAWSLPAWETGLHDVEVDVRAPKGTIIAPESRDDSPGVFFSTAGRARIAQLKWRRIHLPRHTPWRLAFDVPAAAMALPKEPPKNKTPDGFAQLPRDERPEAPWAIALLALFVLAKRRAVETELGRKSLLIPARWLTVILGVVSLIAMHAWLGAYGILSAVPLVALTLHRPRARSLEGPGCSWSTHATAGVSRSQSVRFQGFVDGTTIAGLIIALAAMQVATALDEPVLALAFLPVFFVGTRHHRAPTPREGAERLQRFVATLRLPEHAPSMAFRWERSADGRSRCRISLPVERPGLRALALVPAHRTVGLASRHRAMLLIETRAQSDADDLARRRIAGEPSYRTSEGTVGRLVPWNEDALGLIRALGCSTPRRHLSRGTWLLREIVEAPRKAA